MPLRSSTVPNPPRESISTMVVEAGVEVALSALDHHHRPVLDGLVGRGPVGVGRAPSIMPGSTVAALKSMTRGRPAEPAPIRRRRRSGHL